MDDKKIQRMIESSKLPKMANGSYIPDIYRFKGLTDDMSWPQREHIVRENNLEYTKRKYEEMGITVIGEYNDLFYAVELPEGWEVRKTDHYMWDELIDDKGRLRISFFHKSDFYDRDAFSNFECRYSYKIVPFDDYKTDATRQERKRNPWRLFLTDCGKYIKLLAEITPKTDKEYHSLHDKFEKIGLDFLNEHYPHWKDNDAYWD